MPKALKLFNGRGHCARKRDDPRWQSLKSNACPHIFIAAYSRADARRVVAEYCGITPPDSELRDYFSECWGNLMNDIIPERGLWVAFEQWGTPVRVL